MHYRSRRLFNCQIELKVYYPMEKELEEAINIAASVAITSLEDAIPQIKEEGFSAEIAGEAVEYVKDFLMGLIE